MQIDLSVIIVNYNTKKLIIDCLSSVIKSLNDAGIIWEILVIDNNSNDGSVEAIRAKNYSEVRVIVNNDNIGFGKANNIGINQARGDYVLLLNSDIVVLNNSITKLYGFAKRHNKAFCGGKLYNVDGSKQASCGPFYTLWITFLMLFVKGDKLNLTRYSPEHDRIVDWVSGACIIGPKILFMKTGLFDEKIFMYMDEVDFFYRAGKNNIKTWFYPNARFIHIGAASSKNSSKPVINIFKGLLYFYKKHKNAAQINILKIFLICKSFISIGIGVITLNTYLKKTYAEALRIIK
jgi:GT2 family glycosyltransferase